MQIAEKGLNIIKKFEGLSLRAIKLSGESWYTIGYGHSFDPNVKAGTVWTKEKAEAQLRIDLRKFEKYVDTYVPIKLNQNQFDALVSYTYNRGLGGLKQLVSHSKTIADYSKNIVVYWGSATRYKNGLINRRKAEQALFNTPVAGQTATPKKEEHAMDTLRNGDKGQQVRALQKILGGLKVDGSFGPATKSAVESYQREYKLSVDGIVGPKTWEALLK